MIFNLIKYIVYLEAIPLVEKIVYGYKGNTQSLWYTVCLKNLRIEMYFLKVATTWQKHKILPLHVISSYHKAIGSCQQL